MYPINVKTAEPIGPKFVVANSHDPWEGNGQLKLNNFSRKKCPQSLFYSKCANLNLRMIKKEPILEQHVI